MSSASTKPVTPEALDRLFHALSDATRRAILLRVRDGDKTVNDIASQFQISLPAVSKHLNKLEQAGLITRHKHGRERLCHVELTQMQLATQWLEFYQSFWNERLDSLANLVERQDD